MIIAYIALRPQVKVKEWFVNGGCQIHTAGLYMLDSFKLCVHSLCLISSHPCPEYTNRSYGILLALAFN
jgi:hypothetical protein